MQELATPVPKPGIREAATNLGWLVADRLARLVFTVLVGFWVARYLGPAQFGQLNYALAVVGLGLVLAECGVDAVVRRELIHSPQRAPSLLAAVWRLRLTAGAVCYGVVACWAAWGEKNQTEAGLLAVVGLWLFQPALAVTDLWLQANLRARTSVLAQMIALGFGAAARIALIELRAPLWTFGAVAVGEAWLAAMVLTLWARRSGVRLAADKETGGLIWKLAGESWPLLLSGVAISIYMRIDIVMLRHLAGEGAAGIYAAAVRISELGYFIPVALASSLLPALLQARARGEAAYGERLQRYFDLSAALAYAFSLPLALVAPWLVRLAYGAAFAPAAAVLVVHIWAAVFVFLGVARGQFLVNEGLTGFYLVATSAGAILNVGLNFLLIPQAGAVGAAWATVISYAVSAWLSSYCHPAVRPLAARQTRALLLPFTGWRYLRGT
jgi:PST family polysaccharide transporter